MRDPLPMRWQKLALSVHTFPPRDAFFVDGGAA
jgi:hypothetical protein